MRTHDEILAEIRRLAEDDRYWYETANVFVNAPLALVQTNMWSRAGALLWVLGLPDQGIMEAMRRQQKAGEVVE